MIISSIYFLIFSFLFHYTPILLILILIIQIYYSLFSYSKTPFFLTAHATLNLRTKSQNIRNLSESLTILQSSFKKTYQNASLFKNSLQCSQQQFQRGIQKMEKTGSKMQKQRTGKWKKTQHDQFMKALQKFGKNWTQIQQRVPSRSLSQIRSHAQKIFLTMPKSQKRALSRKIEERKAQFCCLQQKKIQNNNKNQNGLIKEEFQKSDINQKFTIKIEEKEQKKNELNFRNNNIDETLIVSPPGNSQYFQQMNGFYFAATNFQNYFNENQNLYQIPWMPYMVVNVQNFL